MQEERRKKQKSAKAVGTQPENFCQKMKERQEPRSFTRAPETSLVIQNRCGGCLCALTEENISGKLSDNQFE